MRKARPRTALRRAPPAAGASPTALASIRTSGTARSLTGRSHRRRPARRRRRRPVLDVRDLERLVLHPTRRGSRRPGRLVLAAAGRDPRPRRRERIRQDGDRDVDPADAAGQRRDRERRDRLQRRGPARGCRERQMEKIRGRQIGLIPQDPAASLNPLMTVGEHMTELLGVHLGLRGRAARDRTIELLEAVGIPEPDEPVQRLPAPAFRRHAPARDDRARHRLPSGAAHRRRAHHRARFHGAGADPGADRDAGREMNTATILITHNLGIVAGHRDRVAVMYCGPDGGGRAPARAVRRPPPPVHGGTARLRAARGPNHAGDVPDDPGPAAGPVRVASRLRLRAALRVRSTCRCDAVPTRPPPS